MSINAVIDISHYADVTSFAGIKAAGVEGIIHKATQDTGYVDPTYADRKPRALAAGLMWGAYHFGTGDTSGKAQAEHFLSVVNPGPSDLLALDFEENPSGQTMTVEQAVEFVETVQEKTGRYPGFYSGNLIKGDLDDKATATLAKCWFWLAEYSSTPKVPSLWSDWTMWQYTGDGAGPEPHTVDGINGDVDREQFNGDLAALRKLWGVEGAPTSASGQSDPAKKTTPEKTSKPEEATGTLTVEDFTSKHGFERIDSAGQWPIYKVKGKDVIAVKAKMDIDADGSPHAYEPNNKGLDVNIDAKDGSEWVGVATDSHGKPVIQGKNDPAPGYYVSTTSLEDPDPKVPSDSPAKYVDSETVPFIVIPGGSSHREATGWKLGDLATVIRLSDGVHVHAIVADTGPRSKFGEVSIAVAKALGVNPSARIGGDQDNHFGYLIYNNSAGSPPWPRSVADIDKSAQTLFDETVGPEMVAGLKQAPHSEPRPAPAPVKPMIVYSKTEKSTEVESLQKFLNQLPGPALEVSGIPDAKTAARLAQVMGIDLQGAPGGSKPAGLGPFIVYDPHNKTDYTRLLQTWLNTLEGIDLETDSFPGHSVSTALQRVFGSYLPGDPDSGGSASPAVAFDEKHYSQYALRLQTALNAFPGVDLTEDGYPGNSTSDATLEILGARLPFDLRSST